MNDTVQLLQSCHRGTITAINSIEQVMDHVQSGKMKDCLKDTLARHRDLGTEIGERLRAHKTEAEDPSLMARMSVWITTEMRMMGDGENRDHQIAKLVINGCNTGIQTLSEDINRLQDATSDTMDLATSLVTEEQRLMDDLRMYL